MHMFIFKMYIYCALLHVFITLKYALIAHYIYAFMYSNDYTNAHIMCFTFALMCLRHVSAQR